MTSSGITTTYSLDPATTTVAFATRAVFGLTGVHGTFELGHGAVRITATGAEVDAVVRAAGIDTGNRRRDDHVRSRDYLDADEHPDLRFHGTLSGPIASGATVDGELTVRGVTRPAGLTCESVAVDDTGLRARARTTVDRYAFGVTHGKGMTGRYLTLTLDVRATPER